MRTASFTASAVAPLLAAALAAGCGVAERFRGPQIPPTEPGLIDRDNPTESLNPLDADELRQVAEKVRTTRKPTAAPDKRYEILVLSGGGIYGAYPAGLLVGWTERGDRPKFDVVTGVSTGGLIAPFAFLGSDYDCLLRELYTTVSNDDIFKRRPPIRSLLSESLVDNAPMANRLYSLITPGVLQQVAAEHAKGRRLYLGTTNLGTKRLVVWDMGAIAARGTEEARDLFCKIMLASSAVPGFFPPAHLKVDVDGRQAEELHADGGVTRGLFFRPPYVAPSQREGFGPSSLYGSNLYIMVAGKVYADPSPVRPRSLSLAGNGISSLLYAETRGDLARLYIDSMLTGMNYYVAAIPPKFEVSNDSLKFDPVEMSKMFAEGQRQVLAKTAFGTSAPGLDRSEDVEVRSGLRLTKPPDAVAKDQPVAPDANPPTGRPGNPLVPPNVPAK